MHQAQIDRVIKSRLKDLGDAFAPNELAYLALTTKIELPIRDRLAYLLHEELAKIELWAAREWNRFDIAILNNKTTPAALIELKAFYSFDMFTPKASKTFPEAVRQDRIKLERATSKYPAANPVRYNLLLATHLKSKPPIKLDGVVKYGPGLRRYLPTSVPELKRRVLENFGPAIPVAHWEILGGEAFGIQTSVFYWLYKLPSAD